ncbi:MAG: MFS transporter [Thermoplasmata archaeon]|nr:MFS transporter [Thermoplasmata archaeon]
MAGTTTPPAPAGMTSRQRAVLITLAVFALMVTYVETMIVPAIPHFVVFFDGAPISTVAWILTAYLLVGVAVTPIVSKLGDDFGKKRVMLVVMSIYAVAVTVAGFTPEIAAAVGISRSNAIFVLIAVRAVQGIGIGMFPLAFALIGEEFPPEKLGAAQGTVSAMFAVGAALGLAGGAWITQTHGWQFTYHTIIPLAIAAPFITYYVLNESTVGRRNPVDFVGAGLLGGALAAFLIAVSEGPTWGWATVNGATIGGVPIGTPVLFVLALILFVGFLLWEPRVASPMVDFSKLKERNIVLANGAALASGIAMFCFFVGIEEFLQTPVVAGGLGLDVLDAGLASVPASLSVLVFGPMIGKLVGTAGPRPALILGGALTFIGGTTMAIVHASLVGLILASIPTFLGIIAIFIAMVNVVVLSSRPQERGIQTGMNQTFRNVGAAIGPVLASTLLSSFTALVVVGSGTVPGNPLPQPIVVAFPTVAAYEYVFLATAAMGLVTVLLALFVKNYRYLPDGTRVEGGAAPRTDAAPTIPASVVPSSPNPK